MKIINLFIIILIIIFTNTKKIYALENKILFKVNNEIITSIDILNEIQYLKLLNENLKNLPNEKIIEISKNSIVREKVKMIELSKYFENFEIDKKYYELLMEEYVKKLKLKNVEELKSYLKINKLNIKTIEKKIQVELLWSQLILNKFSNDLKINKNEIKEDILKNNKQKEYLVSEIFFNLEKNEKLTEKFLKIKKDIKNNGFINAASINSISDTSKNGGKIGWVKLNTLNKKIKEEITKTEIGNYTNPIVLPGGFLILNIENIRETKIIDNVDKEVEIIAKEIANKQLNQYSNIYLNKIKKEVIINEY